VSSLANGAESTIPIVTRDVKVAARVKWQQRLMIWKRFVLLLVILGTVSSLAGIGRVTQIAMSTSSSSDAEGDEVLKYLATKTQVSSTQKPNKKRNKRMLANVHWRAFTMDELRMHPLYHSLPSLSAIKSVGNAQDLSLFRQGTWQWCALHEGRLTTSKAASCLGFYEPRAAAALGVPKSMRTHSRALEAWAELKLLVPLGPSDWNQLIEREDNQDFEHPRQTEKPRVDSVRCWGAVRPPLLAVGTAPHFASAHILPRWSRSRATNQISRGESSVMAARLAWGSAQEATALVTCLNWLHASFGDRAMLCEVGLLSVESWAAPEAEGGVDDSLVVTAKKQGGANVSLSAATKEGIEATETTETTEATETGKGKVGVAVAVEAESEARTPSTLYQWVREQQVAGRLPSLGASPDGLVRYTDTETDTETDPWSGPCEVVEVKCHSPFRATRDGSLMVGRGGLGASTSPSTINTASTATAEVSSTTSSPSPNSGPSSASLGAWHVPQLQLEMFCAGPSCRSALLVGLTALDGAYIFRMQRDEDYIREMLIWMSKGWNVFAKSEGVKMQQQQHEQQQQQQQQKKKKNRKNKNKSTGKTGPSGSIKVDTTTKPPVDMYWSDPAYRVFVQRTASLAAHAELTALLPQSDVQRADRARQLLVPEGHCLEQE